MPAGNTTWPEALGIAALGIAASYVHYVAGVASALVTVALLVSRVMPFKQAAAVAVTGVVATFPLIGWVRQQVGIHAEPTEPDAFEIFYAFPRFFVPHAVRREPVQDLVGLAIVVAIVVGLALRYRREKRSDLGVTRATRVLGLVTLMVIPFFALAGVLGGAAAVQLRYFAAFAPCVWIATWLLFESAVGGKVAAAVLGALALGGAYRIAKIDLFDQRPETGASSRRQSPTRATARSPSWRFPPPRRCRCESSSRPSRRCGVFPTTTTAAPFRAGTSSSSTTSRPRGSASSSGWGPRPSGLLG